MEGLERKKARVEHFAWLAVDYLSEVAEAIKDIDGSEKPLIYWESESENGEKVAFIFATGRAATGIYDLGESLVKQPQDDEK